MSPHSRRLLPAPKPRPELRVHYETQDQSMHAERQIIEAHGRFRTKRVPDSILRAHHGRVEKHGGADGVAREPEHVQQREIGSQALCGPSLDVEYDLRIEGQAPCEEVRPAAESVKLR